jgi:hypothetical protein
MCPNCGTTYLTTTTAAIAATGQGGHTHSYPTTQINQPLAPEVVKEFAKPDELDEWRKKHIE